MKTLEQYIEESLLDDLDDLEKNVDAIVKTSKSLGKKYKVKYVEVEGLDDVLNNLNKDELNLLTPVYKENFEITDKYGSPIKSEEDIRKLVQIIMDLPSTGNWKATLNKHLKKYLKCIFDIEYLQFSSSLSMRIRLKGLYNGMFISCIKNK